MILANGHERGGVSDAQVNSEHNPFSTLLKSVDVFQKPSLPDV